jgi:hypothetical protein
VDRLVQRIRQHLQFPRHPRYTSPLIEQALRLLQHFPFQHRRRTVARLELVEPFASMVAVQLHVPLHRDHRYAKRFHDLFGFYRPTRDHLAGEHAETPHVCLFVLEHRQVAVDAPDGAPILPRRDFAVDLRHPSGEYRPLQLRHPSFLPSVPSAPQIHFRLILFSSTGAIHWTRSGGLNMDPTALTVNVRSICRTPDAQRKSARVSRPVPFVPQPSCRSPRGLEPKPCAEP